MAGKIRTPMEGIAGHELAAVTFVRDYLQLAFDGPVLTLLLDPVLISSGKTLPRSDPQFCMALVALIGTQVESAEVEPDVSFNLRFVSGDVLTMSLRPDDYRFGPEAATFLDTDGKLSVW